jgi:hypothetical protein
VCNLECGHLASYSSLAEQNEVEQGLIAAVSGAAVVLPAAGLAEPLPAVRAPLISKLGLPQGMLVPRFHRMYWMGLRSGVDTWPVYRWLDPYVPDPSARNGYTNWGSTIASDGSFSLEPSNPSALCGGGSWPMQRGSPPAWGWAGEDCSAARVFICRVQGECSG